MAHDPYRDPCRCKPEGHCYGLAPYEWLCRVFVAEEAAEAEGTPVQCPGQLVLEEVGTDDR